MIIVKIAGGLGNQMFQYASAKSMAKRLNKELYIDLGHYDKYDDRTFKLKEIFNIDDTVLSYKDIPLVYKIYKNRYINFIIRKSKMNIGLKNKFIYQKHFDIDRRLIENDNKNNFYLDGYWQNEEYFVEYDDYIRNKFKLKCEIRKEVLDKINEINTDNSVSVHIRRGDYMNIKNIELYGICPIEYYKNSIKYIADKISEPKFYFFSDDIDWVKENLNIEYECEFIDGRYDDFEELYMMSKCKHNIIANSSFSWWGAWLNTNPDKIIIAPKKWTNRLNTSEQILPKNWIKM